MPVSELHVMTGTLKINPLTTSVIFSQHLAVLEFSACCYRELVQFSTFVSLQLAFLSRFQETAQEPQGGACGRVRDVPASNMFAAAFASPSTKYRASKFS